MWSKAHLRSKEIPNFDKYLKMTETSLNVCDPTIGIQREDQLSVDVIFNQFLEGCASLLSLSRRYVVMREFLIELNCSVAMRGSSLFPM